MEPKMWFGNRNYMRWVKCPESGADFGSQGASFGMSFDSGRVFQKNSLSAAKRYDLSWALTSRENIRHITSFFEGVYGDGSIYWADPFTMDTNVLSPQFATPSLGGYDGLILDGSNVRPEIVPTSASDLGLPTESATYVMTTWLNSLKHFVPIPPGYTAWVGAHGDSEGGQLLIRPMKGYIGSGAHIPVTLQPVTSAVRVSESVTADANTNGIEVILGGSGAITLSDVTVQLLPNGRTPEEGEFISGQGHTGCTWRERPAVSAYNAAMDLMGLSATFIETETWW